MNCEGQHFTLHTDSRLFVLWSQSLISAPSRPQLNDCISLLLGGDSVAVSRTFEKIIQCPQELRLILADRSNKVIKMELDNTFRVLSED